ncbi:glycosyltransferase [Kordiimonas aestuarii]|uniref:glycosyltransferase n=1 Tax=Kordiimonas aestuarii TaxID=1005925 RepID=UPI0021D20298|nr:glycosyltransferase [Kordiimonas aestuarii]
MSLYLDGHLCGRLTRTDKNKPYLFDLPDAAFQPGGYDKAQALLSAYSDAGQEDIAQLALLYDGLDAVDLHLAQLRQSDWLDMLNRHMCRLRFGTEKEKAVAAALAGKRRQGLAIMQAALSSLPPVGNAAPAATPTAGKAGGRIAIVGDFSLPQCLHYRVEQKQEQCRLIGVDVALFKLADDARLIAAMDNFDILIVYRLPLTPRLHEMITATKARGIPVVYEIDDLLFDAQAFPSARRDYGIAFPAEEYAELEILPPAYAAALAGCDHAIASTAPLAAAMKGVLGHDRVFVHPNGLDGTHQRAIEAIPMRQHNKGNKLVLFYGSGTKAHQDDFAHMAKEALVPLLAHHDTLHLALAGHMDLPACLRPFDDRVETLAFRDRTAYWAALSEADINLAPLASSPFNDCKSAIKWLEAAMFGVPTIASHTQGFRQVINDGIDGILCERWQDWPDKLAPYLGAPKALPLMGAKAAERAARDYSARALCDNLSHIIAAVRR